LTVCQLALATKKNKWVCEISGLYYKPMTIVNDDSRVINRLEASLTDDAKVIIYDRHMFLVQATEFDDFLWGVGVAKAS
jgi:hypothetical protein